MVTQVTSTVMGSNAISANNIADNSIVSRHIGDNVILARHVEDGVDPSIVQANLNATTANINTVTANVNSVKGNVVAAEANIAGILNGTNFTGTITTNESTSLGVSNLTPETTSITIGSPANVIIQYDTTAGGGEGGNVIIGEGNGDIDGSLTPFRLDVRGSANVGALSATSLSGTLSTAAQGNITSLGTLTSLTVDNIIVNGTNIGHTSDTDAIAIASDGKTTFSQQTTHSGGIVIPNDGDIGSVGATDAVQISSGGIVTFKDDIILKDAATIGVTSSTSAISIASTGIVTFVDDIKIKDSGTIGSASAPGAITVAGDGAVTVSDDLTITGNLIVSGDTVDQNVTNLTVEDRIILTASGASGTPSLDTGLMMSRGAQGNVFVGYDESVNKVVVAHTSSPHTNTAISATSAANLDARHITAESIVLSGDAGVLVPNDGNIGSAGSTAAIQIASDGVVTFVDDIKIKDGGTIGVASAADAMTVSSAGIVTFKDDILIKDGGTIGVASSTGAITIASTGIVTFADDIKIKDAGTIGSVSSPTAIGIASDGIVTFADDIKIKDAGTIGSASSPTAIGIASDGIVTFADDIKIKDGGTIGVASKAEVITIAADGDTAIAGGLGIAGNTAPVAAAISLGTPANAVIRTHAASGKANIIVGDATATSSYNLDVRGTANVGAFLTQGVDPLANDLATFNRLNANINVVQDNVAAVVGTTLSPATNVVTSVAGANAYGIGAAVTAIARTRVSLSGIGQLPTTDYVIPGSGVIQLTDPSATIPAGIPIHINYWN